MPRIHPRSRRPGRAGTVNAQCRRRGPELENAEARLRLLSISPGADGPAVLLLWPRPHPASRPPGLDTLRAQAWRLQPQGPSGAESVHEPLRNGSRFWKLRKAKGKAKALGKCTPSSPSPATFQTAPAVILFLVDTFKSEILVSCSRVHFFLCVVERTFPIMLDSPLFLSPEVATTDLGGGR